MVSREQCHGHAFNLVPYLQFVFKSKKLFQIKSFKKKISASPEALISVPKCGTSHLLN